MTARESPDGPPTRRAVRQQQLLAADRPVLARHARARRARVLLPVVALVGASALVVGAASALTAALAAAPVAAGRAPGAGQTARVETPVAELRIDPRISDGRQAPAVSQEPAAVDVCAGSGLVAAQAAGDDAAVIAAVGGGESFRAAVARGDVPCVSLADPARIWLVVNKQRPLVPPEYEPAPIVPPAGLRDLGSAGLRADAASAFSAMADAARAAGAGEIAVSSGYRSYVTQQSTYEHHVGDVGVAEADLASAHPGFSEHQTGLAADAVACDGGGCGSLDDLSATLQGQWIAAHAWEFGWIVRYVDGATAVTGYEPEPWHLRYIGADLAAAYHAGGWRTLEEFFGLPPAPDYAR